MTDRASKGLNLNFETVGSIAAMVIGASALFVAWDQAQVMRKQQHASVWPIVSPEFHVQGDDGGRYVEMLIKNAGVGPALIKSVSFEVNKEPVSRWEEIERGLFGADIPGTMAFEGGDAESTVLAPTESSRLIKARWAESDAVNAAFNELTRRYVSGAAADFSATVCYCSVFDRCWSVTMNSAPERVQNCPAPTGFFGALFANSEEQEE